MNLFKKITVAFMCMCMFFAFAACGGGGNGGGGSTNDGAIDYNGTINIKVPFDDNAYNGLKRVISAYRRKHPETTINVTRETGNYTTAVEGIITAPEETNIDIVQINVVSQYYGTDKIIDFTPYLNQPNPYAEEVNGTYPVWKTMLEDDAYLMENNAYTVPALSFESNYVMVSYSKQLFAANGWTEPKNWTELIALLHDAKDKGYTNPLGLNCDADGVGGIMSGMVLQMYMDQYFRDIIDVAHSQPGDYSYIRALDSKWEYSAEDVNIDSQSRYTFNFSRLINAYFNTNDFNPASVRFADMMNNFKQLASYSHTSRDAAESRNSFNNGVLDALGSLSCAKSDISVLFVNRMDFLSDFQASIGDVLEMPNGIIETSELEDYIGWFALPAMPDNQNVEGGAPVANNVRMCGGPTHHPMGVINRNNKKRTDLTMDFLKFWYSPAGMDEFYGYYSERGLVCPLKVLVKDFELPDGVKIDTGLDDAGVSINNPYFEIAVGYNETIQSSNGGTVRDKYRDIIYNYLKSGSYDWASSGERLFSAISSGFSDWAGRYKNMKITSYENITDYYKNSPFKSRQ